MTAVFATLPMYPYAGLREAWDTLYRSVGTTVAQNAPGTPTELDWSIDAHASWVDPRLALSQACGWPLVTALRNRARVLGAFMHRIDGVSSHLYRSVIIAREVQPLSALEGGCAAINSYDSLSGYVSLLAAFAVKSGRWPGEITYTGAHAASIEAVRAGHADLASIDALAWAYLQRLAPRELDGLVVVGRGPLVPCLPLIVAGNTDDALLQAWRSAFAQAMRDSALAAVRTELLIEGFVPLDLADYDSALEAQTRSS